MTVLALIDNDIFMKLVCCDLFEESLKLFKLDRENVGVLETLKYRLKKRKGGYSEAECERAMAIFAGLQAIKASEDQNFSRLNNISSIDVGEAVLIAGAVLQGGSFLWTGDKRCLRALYEYEEVRDIHEGLKGRVICLEQVILGLIDRLGFAEVEARVQPGLKYDQALKLSFGYSVSLSEDGVKEGLKSCIEDLQNSSGGLLIVDW